MNRGYRYAETLGVQAFWVVALALLSTVIWRAGARRVVVQGG